jgi:signal peptidase I
MERQPTRGDVIVFRLPSDPSIDYIKRLVGLPGDKIQVINGVLNINGKPVPRVPDGTFTSDDPEEPGTDVPVYRETLDTGTTYDTLDLNPFSEGDNTQVFVVPPKHYFMMGDNRDNSSDSRFTVGYVPEENLVGRASFIIFSIGNRIPFFQIWNWPANLRYERIFKSIK